MTCFDRYVVVDWSANGRPKRGKDSIWIASLTSAGDVVLANPRTRAEALTWIVAHLQECAAEQRMLVGFDAAFGYPAGFALRLTTGSVESWRAVWQELSGLIEDDVRNTNNRFDVGGALNGRLGGEAGPFWGNGLQRDVAGLPRKKGSFPWNELPEFRITELLGRAAASKPKSVWQLSGAGTVGGQTLTLLPVLEALRVHSDLSERLRVWPFETGFTRTPSRESSIVVAEVWPSALPDELIRAAGHSVKDANQVEALARHVAARDRAGVLADWFEMPDVDAETKRIAIEEEGWILWAD